MKRLLLLSTLVVLTGAAPAVGVRASATTIERAASQADGVVVFASTRDGDSDIYAVNPDGTGLTQLANAPDEDSEPLPSPDGRHILFQGGDGAMVMEADGSGRRSLRGCSFTPEAWSPDSRHVVCSDYEQGLVVLDMVDGTSTQIAESGEMPSWSPDGTTIVFIDENKLFAIPAAGGARRRLGIHKAEEFAAPTWSPDSRRVAYVSPVTDDREALWTIGANGSGGRRLAQNVDEWSPSWSPDGSRIAFVKSLAHDVGAVFVVRADGTHVHRVSASRGGESARQPSWSADGRLVFYIRGRFREAETDIFAVAPTGRGGRALTHPFPAGGSNYDPQWLVGPRLSGGEHLPPTVAVRFKRKLTFATPIAGVAADGTRAVPTLGIEPHPALTVWDAATGRVRRGPVPCGYVHGPGFVALAGDRIAWTCSEAGNTYYAVGLSAYRIGDRRAKGVASAAGDPHEGGDDIVNVVGGGGMIAFSTAHRGGAHESTDPWLLLAHKAKKCPGSGYYDSRAVCRPLGRGRGITTAVDAGRVVTVAPNGLVRLLSTKGRLLRTWSVVDRIVTARLRANTLAVQHGKTVDTYNARTGTKIQTRSLLTDGGPRPFLLDVQGDLVAYATGGAIHLLRLSDGRDRTLRLPSAAPSLDAHLGPAGLFVSWNKMYDRRPGRLAFAPMRAVRRAIG